MRRNILRKSLILMTMLSLSYCASEPQSGHGGRSVSADNEKAGSDRETEVLENDYLGLIESDSLIYQISPDGPEEESFTEISVEKVIQVAKSNNGFKSHLERKRDFYADLATAAVFGQEGEALPIINEEKDELIDVLSAILYGESSDSSELAADIAQSSPEKVADFFEDVIVGSIEMGSPDLIDVFEDSGYLAIVDYAAAFTGSQDEIDDFGAEIEEMSTQHANLLSALESGKKENVVLFGITALYANWLVFKADFSGEALNAESGEIIEFEFALLTVADDGWEFSQLDESEEEGLALTRNPFSQNKSKNSSNNAKKSDKKLVNRNSTKAKTSQKKVKLDGERADATEGGVSSLQSRKVSRSDRQKDRKDRIKAAKTAVGSKSVTNVFGRKKYDKQTRANIKEVKTKYKALRKDDKNVNSRLKKATSRTAISAKGEKRMEKLEKRQAKANRKDTRATRKVAERLEKTNARREKAVKKIMKLSKDGDVSNFDADNTDFPKNVRKILKKLQDDDGDDSGVDESGANSYKSIYATLRKVKKDGEDEDDGDDSSSTTSNFPPPVSSVLTPSSSSDE